MAGLGVPILNGDGEAVAARFQHRHRLPRASPKAPADGDGTAAQGSGDHLAKAQSIRPDTTASKSGFC